MNKALIKSFLGAATLKFLGKGFTVVLGIVLARYLGPDHFGQYSFVMSIISIAVIPTVAGLPQLLIRDISRYVAIGEWRILKGILIWSNWYVIILSLFSVLSLIFIQYMGYFSDEVIYLLSSALIMVPLKGLMTRKTAIINALQKPILAQVPLNFLWPLISSIILFLYLTLYSDLNSKVIIHIQITALIISYIAGLMIYYKIKPTLLKGSTAKYNYGCWFKSLLPFSILFIVSSLNSDIATLFLGFLSTNSEVSAFKVAAQAMLLIVISLEVINAITGPKISSMFRQDVAKTQKLITQSVRLSFILTFPLALVLFIFGDELINALFGKQYLHAVPLLKILCIGQLFNVCMGSVGLILNMTGNEKYTLRTLSLTLLLNIFFMYLSIPTYGALGAAASVTASIVIWNIIMAYDVYILTNIKPWIR